MRVVYGLLAEFTDEEELLQAAAAARQAGYRQVDAFSPFPVEGLAETLGFRPRVPMNWIVVGGLVIGAIAGFGLQYYTTVLAYPLNIGGRPLNSWPSFIPVTIMTAILIACVTAIVGMFVLNGMPLRRHPVFNVESFRRASQDRFFLLIDSDDEQFDIVETHRFLLRLYPLEVSAVER